METKEQKYKVLNGTRYEANTPVKVSQLLEYYRRYERVRLIVHNGDIVSGAAWGDTEEGYIGRSCGAISIPIIIHNKRSLGGGAILDNCIVAIQLAKGKKFIYKHPNFKQA